MSGSEIAELMGAWLTRGVTGAIEWKDDRRRRLFFFEAGQLVAVQSNLKSESPQRVAERHPGLGEAGLRRRVVEERVRGALSETVGAVQLHLGVDAPAREPVDLIDVLWAVADALPMPSEAGFPRTRAAGLPALAAAPLPEDLRPYLADLDGTRALEDVVAFGPAEPEVTRRALALATVLGAVEVLDAEAPAFAVTTPPARPGGATAVVEATFGARAPAQDIGSLISQELGGPPAAAVTASGYEVVLPRRAAAAPPQGDAEERRRALARRVLAARDHFEALGVSWQESPEALRRAYVSLARDLHPDAAGGVADEVRDDLVAAFDRVRAAWEVLGDATARETYVARVVRGEKSDEEKAMERVRLILEAESDFKRGVNELNAGRILAAHEIFQRVIERVPEDQEFRAYHGYTTFRLHLGRDPRKAEEGFRQVEEAVKARENFDQGYVLIGMMHRAVGDEAKARQSFVQALRLKPSNPDALREMRRDPSRNPFENPNAGKEPADSIWSKLFKSK